MFAHCRFVEILLLYYNYYYYFYDEVFDVDILYFAQIRLSRRLTER